MNKQDTIDLFIAVDFKGIQETNEIRKKIRSRAAHHSHKIGRKSHKKSTRGGSTSLVSSTARQHAPLQQSLVIAEILRPVLNGFVYPVPELHFYRSTMYFMWKWMLDAWSYLDTTELERHEALIWVQRLTMSNPSYFYMNMLSCCTVLVDQRSLPAQVIPWLMTQTVRAINDALTNPQQRLEIGVILAVGRIALRECMKGNYEVGAKIHRPAQARMLAMAGGLDALAIPTLVRKHVLWAERLVTKRTGVTLSMLHPGAVSQASAAKTCIDDDLVLDRYSLKG